MIRRRWPGSIARGRIGLKKIRLVPINNKETPDDNPLTIQADQTPREP